MKELSKFRRINSVLPKIIKKLYDSDISWGGIEVNEFSSISFSLETRFDDNP